VRHAYDEVDTSGVVSSRMDSLTYSYPDSTINQLDRVQDAVTGEPYAEDLAPGQAAGYYQYDAIGNLTAEGTTSMTWDSYGRLKTVNLGGASPATVSFLYDAAGNRVK
jgi:YD repeat-containing protein